MSEKLKRIASFIEALPVEVSTVDCESVLLSGGVLPGGDSSVNQKECINTFISCNGSSNGGTCQNSACNNTSNTGACKNLEGSCGGKVYNGTYCQTLKNLDCGNCQNVNACY